ncbi:PAS domain-containing sensor histidine kinase [Methanospirillum lacunae]|nr:PAS domain-containing sensor histidine kinase [Methanospirillum lacunae]
MSHLTIASCRFTATFPSQIFLSSSEIVNISGYSPDNLEKPGGFDRYILKTDLSKRELVIRHAIWTKKTYSLEYGFHHADGTVHTFIERGNVCTNACDMWLDVVLIDLTEHKNAYLELRDERNLFKQAFDSIKDYVSIISPDNKVIFVNKSLSDRIMQSPEDNFVQYCCSSVTENTLQQFSSKDTPVSIDSRDNEEVHDDITRKIYAISRTPIQITSGEILGNIQISRDISIKKYQEESFLQTIEKVTEKLHELRQVLKNLESANVLLEQEVMNHIENITEMSKIIKDKNLQVEQLVSQKEFFIRQLAHDLRTPLTPVIAMLPLIIDGIKDPDSKELLKLFSCSIENLQNMVNTIVQYATLNQLTSIDDYGIFDIEYLIDDAFKVNSFLIKEKELNIDISLPPDISISLSKNLGPLIFRNLISNAVSNNIFRGSISILGEVHMGKISISISDSGIGITPHLLETMWDEFVIGDTARNNPCSKGLGLSIVKQIVTMHGGSIIGTSKGIGTGATFTITLPLNHIEQPSLCKLLTNTKIYPIIRRSLQRN